ncbi:MAG: winged helix-turn-helix domain-containing protein [Catenulispora sp.]
MRYADGGGLHARGRARREEVRMPAAELFEQQVAVKEIATRLRVSATSVFARQAAWRRQGRAALVSKGPSGTGCRLSDTPLSRPQTELDAGPAVHGGVQDQRWTRPRITLPIGRLFRLRSTERGVSHPLHRLGCSPRVAGAPGGRAGRGGDHVSWPQTCSRGRAGPASVAPGSVCRTRPAGR